MKIIQFSLLAAFLVLSTTSLFVVTHDAVATDSVTYTMKGIVKALPGGGRAANEVLIKHEAVPDYRDSEGKVVGMSAMTMPFYLKEGVLLGDLKVGDSVTFTVVANWEPRFTEVVTEINRAN